MMVLFFLHMKAIGFRFKLMDTQPQSALCDWIILNSSALFLSCSSLQLFVLARVDLSPDSSCLKSFPPTHISLNIHLIFNGRIIIFSFALAKTILSRRRDRSSHLPICTEQTVFIQTGGGKHFQGFAKNCFSLSNGPDLKWTQIWTVISSLKQRDRMKIHQLRQGVLGVVAVDWRVDKAGWVLWLCPGQL